MIARLYRVKDTYTGLKYCLSKKPVSMDYIYSGNLNADTLDRVYSLLKAMSRDQVEGKKNYPLKPGDIVVIEGCAYMSLKDNWVAVTFNEKEAYV